MMGFFDKLSPATSVAGLFLFPETLHDSLGGAIIRTERE